MMSGDNVDTCKMVAFEAGIVDRNSQDEEFVVMDGFTFYNTCQGIKEKQDAFNNTL